MAFILRGPYKKRRVKINIGQKCFQILYQSSVSKATITTGTGKDLVKQSKENNLKLLP